MRDIPIIFSAPMVRALLEGRKTQTRRRIAAQPLAGKDRYLSAPMNADDVYWPLDHGHGVVSNKPGPHPKWVERWVRYEPGDHLWVRETWAAHKNAEQRIHAKGDGHPWGSPIYKATFHSGLEPKCEGFGSWRSPIHMPRWASRLTLLVENVKVERLHDISEEDALAEGIQEQPHHAGRWLSGFDDGISYPSPTTAYEALWESINGYGSLAENPWVCAITFKVEEPK